MRYLAIISSIILLIAFGCSCSTSTSTSAISPHADNTYTANPPAEPGTFHKRVDPVWIDASFSLKDKLAIESALSEWNYVLNGYQSFEVVSDKWNPSDTTPSQYSEASYLGLRITALKASMPDVDEGVLAWVPDLYANEMYIVTDRIGTRDLRSTVLHEIGHILGLDHIAVRGSLMWPYYPEDANCVDKVSILFLASTKRSHYDWHHMNWCSFPR